ncbi:MAG: hypothetical protein ACTSQF_08160 [Candidatus Heimdallarchaeaceae archaeon]
MESIGRSESTNHLTSKKTLFSKIKRFMNPLKLISLFLCLLIGEASFGLFGGMFWSLDDLEYYALLGQMNLIGYICAGFAVLTIVLSLIFKKNDFIFVIFSFLTAIFGSFQFIVFAISPFREGLFGHYQYIITFALGMLILMSTYLYVITSRKK